MTLRKVLNIIYFVAIVLFVIGIYFDEQTPLTSLILFVIKTILLLTIIVGELIIYKRKIKTNF